MNFDHAYLIDKWTLTVNRSDEIFTWTEHLTLCYIAEIASTAEYMVECGTYHGRTAKVIMDAGCKHLWCIDLFIVPGDQHVTRHFLKKEIKDGRCELIVGDSQRGGQMLSHMKGKVDAVWVDDGHAKEDLIRDITCLGPLVKPGGLLFGHDYDGDNDVAQGVHATGIKFEIPVPRVWASQR